VVVNSITGQPIEGVEAAIRGSTLYAVADAKGAYLIKDVLIGEDYVLTYTKAQQEGELKYRFHTKDNVTVDPEQYKNDDPFAEYEALQGQLEALKLPGFPDAAANVTLTFPGGVWVKEDGTAGGTGGERCHKGRENGLHLPSGNWTTGNPPGPANWRNQGDDQAIQGGS
jgi:hypothetical protein